MEVTSTSSGNIEPTNITKKSNDITNDCVPESSIPNQNPSQETDTDLDTVDVTPSQVPSEGTVAEIDSSYLGEVELEAEFVEKIEKIMEAAGIEASAIQDPDIRSGFFRSLLSLYAKR